MIEFFAKPTPELEDSWVERWNAWPTGHLFNHPRWLKVVQDALPGKRSLAIRATADRRDRIFMAAEETDQGLQLAGTPYLDKGSVLWDPELSGEEWNEFVSALLDRYRQVSLQELALSKQWLAGLNVRNGWVLNKYSSANPWFAVDSPRISGQTRYQLRRLTRAWEKEGAVGFSLRKFRAEDVALMQGIEDRSSKVQRGKAVLNDPDYRSLLDALLKQFPENSWIMLLSLNGRPAAHCMGVSAKARLILLHTAFVKEYARLSPGNVLFFNILPLLQEQGIKEVDYGRGLSVMKSKLAGDNDVPQHNLYYFRKDAGGWAARARTEMVWSLIAAGRLLRRTGGASISPILDRLALRR
jgi:CelD/BcsL family acetyltransferase involved in cellulose biosynthesis